MKLANRIAVVTGCGPNINGGIAYGLAEEGAKVVCVDQNSDYANACAAAIQKRGGHASAIKCNVTSEDDIRAAIGHAEATFGPVQILINGAAIQIRKGLLDVSLEEFRRQIEVSLTGSFLFTKHVAQAMVRHGIRGSIINIGSTEGHQGNLGNLAYGTAKGGLLQFTRAAAMDLAEHGIRVNSLTPTGTDPKEGRDRALEWGVKWDQAQTTAPRPDMTWGDQGVPLGQRPSPRHYAKAAVFLASDDSEMITGTDIRVDGGTVSRYWRWNPGTSINA
jgi:NAD(P)-dependent dehydrogenase (short-subunit alcohol dehydrogenase family)